MGHTPARASWLKKSKSGRRSRSIGGCCTGSVHRNVLLGQAGLAETKNIEFASRSERRRAERNSWVDAARGEQGIRRNRSTVGLLDFPGLPRSFHLRRAVDESKARAGHQEFHARPPLLAVTPPPAGHNNPPRLVLLPAEQEQSRPTGSNKHTDIIIRILDKDGVLASPAEGSERACSPRNTYESPCSPRRDAGNANPPAGREDWLYLSWEKSMQTRRRCRGSFVTRIDT